MMVPVVGVRVALVGTLQRVERPCLGRHRPPAADPGRRAGAAAAGNSPPPPRPPTAPDGHLAGTCACFAIGLEWGVEPSCTCARRHQYGEPARRCCSPKVKNRCSVIHMPKFRLTPQNREFYELLEPRGRQPGVDLPAPARPARALSRPASAGRRDQGSRAPGRPVAARDRPADDRQLRDADRSRGHLSLATAIDDVCDFMDQVADELNLYGVEEVPQEAIAPGRVDLPGHQQLSDAIEALDRLQSIHHHLVDIHTLEDEGWTGSCRSATAKLFSNGLDPLVVIRWKTSATTSRMAVDKCETAAHVLRACTSRTGQRCPPRGFGHRRRPHLRFPPTASATRRTRWPPLSPPARCSPRVAV